MTSTDDQRLPWRLYQGLERIAAAASDDDTLTATTEAAHDLAGVDGMYVFCHDGSATVALRTSIGSSVSTRDATLRKLIAPDFERAGPRLRRLNDCKLPDGPSVAADMIFLSTSEDPAPWHDAIGFFWSRAPSDDDLHLMSLPALASAYKFTLRRNAQARLEEQQHHHVLMEWQHRVRNLLALLRSVIRRSSEGIESNEESVLHLEARISAVARTQGGLLLAGDAGPEMEDLLRAEFSANAVREGQFSLDGPSVRLAPRAAETIALAFHELTTNALKFGALTAPTGHIHVHWTLESQPEPTLCWHWQESGIEAPPKPQRRGFGQELIERMLPYELGARTAFGLAPGGLRCEIRLPLTERIVAATALGPWRNV